MDACYEAGRFFLISAALGAKSVRSLRSAGMIEVGCVCHSFSFGPLLARLSSKQHSAAAPII